MNKNVNNYKYIVNTGCSYGVMIQSIFGDSLNYQIKNDLDFSIIETDDEIIYIDVSMSSQGTDWQSESVIHVCNNLLEMGVYPENIFVFIEWSQWSRITVHPFQLYNLDINKLNFVSERRFLPTLFSNNNLTLLNELNFNISSTYQYGNVGKINDTVFMNLNSMEEHTFKNLGIEYEIFFKNTKKLQLEIPQEFQLRNYFNTIIKTQNYLKSNSINYNCVHMQCDLNGWKINENNIVLHILTHEKYDYEPYSFLNGKLKHNENYKLLNKKQEKIEDVLPEFKIYINQIDFNNFWFYENNEFARGGYDEWCIDNFKEMGFINLNSLKKENLNIQDLHCTYGEHPNPILYSMIWNDISKNCNFLKINTKWNETLLEKFWDDYNSNEFTKNEITLSKKYWDRIVNDIY